MNPQVQINFLDGSKLFLDKDQINRDKDPSYRQFLIRHYIKKEKNIPVEVQELYLDGHEECLEEYHNQDILFCLIKPLSKFENQLYHFTIKNMGCQADMTLTNLEMSEDQYANRMLDADCEIIFGQDDDIKQISCKFNEEIEIEQYKNNDESGWSELVTIHLDEYIWPDKDIHILGPWNLYPNGRVEYGPWQNYPCYYQ